VRWAAAASRLAGRRGRDAGWSMGARRDGPVGEGAARGEVVVRAVEPRDVAGVWELLRGLAEYERLTHALTGSAERLGDALFGEGDRLRGLVAERSGRLVGYALFYPVFGSFRARWRLWLEDVYVAPDARGSGAGRAMLGALARAAVEGGYEAIDWEVLDWNRSAIGFYEGLSARPTGGGWLKYRVEGEALAALAEARDAKS